MCSDHPQRAFVSLYRCAKFGCNRYSSFDNMQLLLFRDLGLKTPIHAPKLGFWGGFDPLNGELCLLTFELQSLTFSSISWTLCDVVFVLPVFMFRCEFLCCQLNPDLDL